jgi:hypothetical protein
MRSISASLAVRDAIVDRDRPADHVERSLRLSPLQADDAEMMQAAEVIAIDRDRLPVKILGLEQLSGLMMAHGERE